VVRDININLPDSITAQMPAPVNNITVTPADNPAPVVNVAPPDLTSVTEAVRELSATGKSERAALDALTKRSATPPLVTVAMPDTMNMRIIEQPKRTRKTRITDRDGNGRVLETVTDEE
jgi:hypothetical protein